MQKIIASVVFAILLGAGLSAAVPNPVVIGPIPATVPPGDPSHDYPFFSTTVNLASHGYIEQEFFFEGVANRYNMPGLTTGVVIDSGHPFRTRMVVRRPASTLNFGGTVVMEWQNVSAGFDFDAAWDSSHDNIIRRGYAWVGVSAQRVGIHQPVTGLKAWSPIRYGSLDVTQGGSIADDSLAYDIFSQAAQAVRNPMGVDPMSGLPVKRVFATGGSQSAARLVDYHNAIHPLAGVFDGYFIVVGGGLLRTDLNVKVFKVLSETDVAGIQAAIRQPDSNHFRRWEVAGSAHVDFYLAQELTALQVRDFGRSAPPNCSFPPLSRIPFRFVLAAAFDHLVEWVKNNVPPPTAPDIELVTITPTAAVVARDGFGNALGGIRLSQHAVPTATNTGLNSGPGFCRLFGSYQPFDAVTLDSLYPNHGNYVMQVTHATTENRKAGFIVQEDAITTIRDGAQSAIGR
jgi:alpha/beta hydrolase family protein